MSLPHKAKQIDPLIDAIQWKIVYDLVCVALKEGTPESLRIGCSNARLMCLVILKERDLDPDVAIMEQQ